MTEHKDALDEFPRPLNLKLGMYELDSEIVEWFHKHKNEIRADLELLAAIRQELDKMIEAREKLACTFPKEFNLSFSDIVKADVLWGKDGDALMAFYGDYHGSEEDDAKFVFTAANSIAEIKRILGE